MAKTCLTAFEVSLVGTERAFLLSGRRGTEGEKSRIQLRRVVPWEAPHWLGERLAKRQAMHSNNFFCWHAGELIWSHFPLLWVEGILRFLWDFKEEGL
jgi:hypothetical protein